MTDNINTADLVKRLRDEHVAASRTEAADCIEQLEAALTRANAATAAAYEVAAREVECGCGAGPCQDTANCSAEDAAAIRALATPDQTAALDKLIAEAVEEEVGRVTRIAASLFPGGYDRNHAAILAASKKGGV